MKQAILLIHFGTTHDDTREKTIDTFRKKVEQEFTECDIFEAFTSRMIIKRLKARGIEKKNPLEVLEYLKENGYTHVWIQTTHLLHGIEYENLKEEMMQYIPYFERISMGKALLNSIEDYKQIAHILGERERIGEQEAVVYIGHGTKHSANASYPTMRYVFVQEGHPECFIGTVEGYPELDEVVYDIQSVYGSKKPKLILRPLMFVAGEHAKNDIAEDWKEDFEEKGFVVKKVVLEGLGEIPEIQMIFVEHLRDSMKETMSMAEYKKRLS